MQKTVQIEDPDLDTVKTTDSRGRMYLGDEFANAKISVVGEFLDEPEQEIPAEVGIAKDAVADALDADDEEQRTQLLRNALGVLDKADEERQEAEGEGE